MALWRWLQVPGSPAAEIRTLPDTGYLLIWGGSTITAQFAIQIAVLGGLKVIAVTSSKTKPLAEGLGATYVITRDGKSGDEIVAEIQAIGGDDITRCIDLVGTETANYCLRALSKTKKALFAPLAMISNKAVVPENISVETVEMKKFVLDETSEVYSLALNKLLEEKKITLPEIVVMDGGLDVIQEGLDRVKRGDMAGKKVVVRMH
jgi:NADPH:quinone reductase-like Zn-dependent oxidoreductase